MLLDAPLGSTYYNISTLPSDQWVESTLFLMKNAEDDKHVYNKDAGLGTLTIKVLVLLLVLVVVLELVPVVVPILVPVLVVVLSLLVVLLRVCVLVLVMF